MAFTEGEEFLLLHNELTPAVVREIAEYVQFLETTGCADVETPDQVKELKAENERLREVIDRLGSSEAFTLPFFLDHDKREVKELIARMDFARQALATKDSGDE